MRPQVSSLQNPPFYGFDMSLMGLPCVSEKNRESEMPSIYQSQLNVYMNRTAR
jgi:hypothetical protein